MPKIIYVEKRFSAGSLEIIEHANRIIEAYQDQGLYLTLRQLYYRFVATGLIANQQKEYKRLGSVINDGRLAGLIDWNAIEDRGRSLNARSSWGDPGDIINSAARSYAIDLWKGQAARVEVWVEKQALEAVIEQAAEGLNCASFACKGYTSQSSMWRAGQRFKRASYDGQRPVVIHLGDHDPSGIDMTRDIQERLQMFAGIPVEVNRIALNMDQIEEFSPPPNPAKLSDSRAQSYIAEYGRSSWELDALEPAALRELIQEHIKGYLDMTLFKARKAQQESERLALTMTADNWDEVVELMEERHQYSEIEAPEDDEDE